MKTLLFAVLLAGAAGAPADSLFELHAESAAGAPNAKVWHLAWKGRPAETITLDSAVLLDASALASAETEAGPDGSPQIRLVLTPEGAARLAEITRRQTGRRLGIVIDGRLRAAPIVMVPITDGVLVVAGSLARSEADGLAARLAPPPPARVVPRASERDREALRVIEGTWTVVNAMMSGRPAGDPKLMNATFTFQDGELALVNGDGQTARFVLRLEPESPRLLALEPLPPSRERGGFMLFAREGDHLTLAFYDNLEGRPESFDPAPKKIVLKLARQVR